MNSDPSEAPLRVLTPEEAAPQLRVTPQCVRQQLVAGRLPGFRVGRLWRIPSDQFCAFLRGEWTPPTPAADDPQPGGRRLFSRQLGRIR